MKLITLGLDGASFNLLQPWIDQGFLPNFAEIQKKGSWGELKVYLPPVTSPNWKCFSTGKNPGKFGVFWWENIDMEKRKIIIPRSHSFKSEEIWDWLGKTGYRVGILNMPTCYPPKKVNGFMVAGGPDALETGFSYPSELEKYLKQKYNWRVLPKKINFLERGEKQVFDEIYDLIEKRFTVAIDLVEKYNLDFLHLTIYLINVLNHFFWDDERVLKAWQILDGGIGKLQRKFPQADILIFSDHGSEKIKVKFNINNWLSREGYLVLKKGEAIKKFLQKLGLNQENLAKIAAKLGIKDALKKYSPRLKFIFPTPSGASQTLAKEQRIDWERTQVLASGQGPIYINSKSKSQNPKLRDELIRKLEKLEYKGIKIARKVYKREEIYKGEFLAQAPDLIVDQGEGVHISGSVGFKEIFETPKKWLAENKKVGLFMSVGPNIERKVFEKVHILDLVPTVLYLLNTPFPKDLDGRVLEEIIKK